MKQDIRELLNRYRNGSITEQEMALLETWYLKWVPESQEISMERLDMLEKEVYRNLPKPVQQTILWPRIAVAAAILVFLSVGGYFLFHHQTQPQIVKNEIQSDVVPGSNKAILTLSNGQQISLTDATVGAISAEGNQVLQKTNDGTIVYGNNTSSDPDLIRVYNTISTPRGGQWSVVLPDGTKVMLDAASTLKYPVSFGREREVELSGQAYFDVTHNAERPFRVITKDQIIEDIGTAFNVNAYGDEPLTQTSLLEGAVEVFSPAVAGRLERTGLRLKPGQQALTQNHKMTMSSVNTEEAIAWKNGYFNFHDESIESIMRKLSRWYDIEVEYRGNLPDRKFDGEVSRSFKLSETLKILETANIHFKIQGKKIIVSP